MLFGYLGYIWHLFIHRNMTELYSKQPKILSEHGTYIAEFKCMCGQKITMRVRL